MKNLIYISNKVNSRQLINGYISRAKFFCEQAKTENEEKLKQENTNQANQDKKNKKVNNDSGLFSKGLDKFKNLWKHTFNYTESIEDKIEKRKQEAAITKSQYKELTPEEIDEV